MNLKALINWSKKEFSDLPWRKNRSLYRTLVSEIMLQQTTVGTVKNHYERFLEEFPTLSSLAEATEDELTVAWKGLGYYRRARNLKKIAETIHSEFKDEFPQDIETLKTIPGIGPYTASAIVGIGMDKRALAVDANLERVISRLFNLKIEKGLKLQSAIGELFRAKEIFPGRISFRDLNQALMDLGRTYCQARRVSCELCPLRKDCHSFQTGTPLKLPYSNEIKKTVEHEIQLLRFLVMKKNELLVYKKGKDEWLSGQFEVPTFIQSTTDKTLKQYPKLEQNFIPDFSFKTGITKYKIQNNVVILSEKGFKSLKFPYPSEWRSVLDQDSNFSTATLKALAKLPQR